MSLKHPVPPQESPAVIVRTVLGDVAPERLGLVLGHEHLIARPPSFITDEDLRLDDEGAAQRELDRFREAGGGAVVEMTTVDYGRDVLALERLARHSAIHIVAVTGFNQGKFADPIVEHHTDEELRDWLVREVEEGVLPYQSPEQARLDREVTATVARAGVIKASSGSGGPSDGERRGLEAAAAAQRLTGAPISTHTHRAEWALEQVQLFSSRGVSSEKVLIGHLDFRPELPFLLEVAATGVYLGFDQFSKSKYLADEERVRLIVGLAEEGYLHRLILSGDLARRSYWPAYGNPAASGFSHIPLKVGKMLEAMGLAEEQQRVLLEENPQRWLAFVPSKAGATGTHGSFG